MCLYTILFVAFLQNVFGQDNNYKLELKKGLKFHYKGFLITDTINKYPTSKLYTERDFNARFQISDLIIEVDTVIKHEEYLFCRFLFKAESELVTRLSEINADIFFVPSAEPRRDFNLLFFNNEIYTISPTEGISNPLYFDSDNLKKDPASIAKLDASLHTSYNVFYNKYITDNGCLLAMLKSRTLAKNGYCKLTLPSNQVGCKFELHPFINLNDTALCNSDNRDNSNYFYCLKSKGNLFFDKNNFQVKEFKISENSRSANFTNSYFISNSFIFF